jgi:hypothetical protein
MSRHIPAVALVASLAILLTACGGSTAGPALTDPTAIITAALKSTEAAKSVYFDVTVDGKASIVLPGSGAGTTVDLTGTTATGDIDFANKATKVTFKVPKLLGFTGELIAVDGKVYTKTSLTGPQYSVQSAESAPVNPGDAGGMIDNLGDLLLDNGITLTKGDDVACGGKQCYSVTTELTAADLGLPASGAISALPIDLQGASLKITVLVEKDLPYHLAEVTAVLSLPNDASVTAVLTTSKWDEPVTIQAPPPDQVKPTS